MDVGTTGEAQAQRQGQCCKGAGLRLVSELEVSLLVATVPSSLCVLLVVTLGLQLLRQTQSLHICLSYALKPSTSPFCWCKYREKMQSQLELHSQFQCEGSSHQKTSCPT